MEQKNNNFNNDFETPICDEEAPPCRGEANKEQASMFTVRPVSHYRLAAVSLAILAAVLLMVTIGLGVHYNKLTDMHLSPDDTERISKELADLQHTYKAAVETTKGARKQLDSEMSSQTKTNWELEHQTERSNNYKSQIETFTQEIETMRSRLPMISDGCKHCPAGWILMNSVCYYFSDNGHKTWKESRDFCQLFGGDLIIIKSQDKENSTVNYLRNHQDAQQPVHAEISDYSFSEIPDDWLIDWSEWRDVPIHLPIPSQILNGYWIGLRRLHVEGFWKWRDGTSLVEGYWNDGEPSSLSSLSSLSSEDCAAVDPTENLFKAWNDDRCDATRKWICEKAPTSMS